MKFRLVVRHEACVSNTELRLHTQGIIECNDFFTLLDCCESVFKNIHPHNNAFILEFEWGVLSQSLKEVYPLGRVGLFDKEEYLETSRK